MVNWSWANRLLEGRLGSSSYSRVDSNAPTTSRFDFGAKAVRRVALVIVIIVVIIGSLHSINSQVRAQALVKIAEDVTAASRAVVVQWTAAVQKIKDAHDQHDEKSAAPSLENIRETNKVNCERRRAEYRSLVDSRTLSDRLERNAEGKLTGFSYELATTQPLFSETCWTVDDRYSIYKTPVDTAVNKCNELLEPSSRNRTAIVLALEYDVLFTEDAVLNLRALIVEVGWYHNYDVVLLQNIKKHDETPEQIDKIPEEFRDLVVKFTNDDVFEGYPESPDFKTKIDRHGMRYATDFDKYCSTFYQFAQVGFFDTFPEYKFAYFLESHVRSTGNYQELFSAIQSSAAEVESQLRSEGADVAVGGDDIDLITLDPVDVIKPAMYWTGPELASPESYFRGKLVVHGVSRNLVVAMNETLMSGTNAPHEAFLPAVAVKYGFNIAMFAHPIMKRPDGLLFETYSVPSKQNFKIMNLAAQQQQHDRSKQDDEEESTRDQEQQRQVWQHGGTFNADAQKWVDHERSQTKWINDLYQDWKRDPGTCVPGLLVYPVSGK